MPVPAGIRTSIVLDTGFALMVCVHVMPHGLVKPVRFKFARTTVPIVMDRANVIGRVIIVIVCMASRALIAAKEATVDSGRAYSILTSHLKARLVIALSFGKILYI